MITARRDFLKLGALFVPALAAPTVAYSFLWAPKEMTFTMLDVGWRSIGAFTINRGDGSVLASGHFENGVAIVDTWSPTIAGLRGLNDDEHGACRGGIYYSGRIDGAPG